MSYQTALSAKDNSENSPATRVIKIQMNEFEKTNQEYKQLLDLLEDKCHTLISKRERKADNEKGQPAIYKDFVSELDERIMTFSGLNNRLRLLVQHLDEII